MNRSSSPGRGLSVLIGLFLLLASALFAAPLVASLVAPGGSGPLAEAGATLFEAFGPAAAFLPLWLLGGSLLLLGPGYRPEAHFLLAGSLLPFACLVAALRAFGEPGLGAAFGARFLGRPELGSPILGSGGVLLTLAATALVIRLRFIFFPRSGPAGAEDPADPAYPENDGEVGRPEPLNGKDADEDERAAFAPTRPGFLPLLGEGGFAPAAGAASARKGVETAAPGGDDEFPGGEYALFTEEATGARLDGQVQAGSPPTPSSAGYAPEPDGDATLDELPLDDGAEADDDAPIPVFFGARDGESDDRDADGDAHGVSAASRRPALIRDPVRSGVSGGAPGDAPAARAPSDRVLSDRVLSDRVPSDKVLSVETVPPAPRLDEPPALAGRENAKKTLLGRKTVAPYAVPTNILTQYPDGEYWIVDDKTRKAAETLRETLREFGIEAEVTGIRKGPVITMFEILPAPGVRLSKIANLSDNIALRLAASSVRIVAPIPGKHAVGIEVPNDKRNIVSFRELVENEAFRAAKLEIPVALGKDIAGEPQIIDLVQTPHLLIAGATGSGKSVCVNALILSILYRRAPSEVRLILIDPKIVELKLYNGVAHLLTPVITEPKKAFQALQYCICEMERRYSLLDHMGVRDIRSYNRKIADKKMATERLPYIVVVIDEFADLMATTGKELESTLARLAAMSRAVGIHLVLATQRPSIDVITGLIKANIPSRIAFMVASKFDSRIIIDAVGAEKLLGKGDMLLSSAWDAFPYRMQGAFVSEEEVERVADHVRELGEPEYIDDEIFIDDEDEDSGPSLFDDEDDDPLFEKALEIVLQQGKASASYIQRKLKIGYNRSARLVELMEEKGIVGPAKGSKPRDVVRNPEVLGRAPHPAARAEDAGFDDGDPEAEEA